MEKIATAIIVRFIKTFLFGADAEYRPPVSALATRRNNYYTTPAFIGADDENRTRINSLEGYHSAVELHPLLRPYFRARAKTSEFH